MKMRYLFVFLLGAAAGAGAASLVMHFKVSPSNDGGRGTADRDAEAVIRALYDQEHQNLERMDVEAQERFLPDDFVVTNPFNMFIDKGSVIERMRTDIIKYETYRRRYDYFRRYGDTMFVAGSEEVVPTADANRPDAGQKIDRRFTEAWVFRSGRWEKVIRHASNISQ